MGVSVQQRVAGFLGQKDLAFEPDVDHSLDQRARQVRKVRLEMMVLKVLRGQKVPQITKLVPQVWDNTSRAKLKGRFFRKLGPLFQAAWNVPGYSHYSFNQMVACFGKS